MSNLSAIFPTQHNCNYVKAISAVLNFVSGKKVASRAEHSVLLGFGDNRLRRTEILVRPGFYLYKDKHPVTIDHNQVDFACLTGEVVGESFESFTL
jgi:hypothetical protein